MPKVIISDKASYTLMLSPPRWRKPTHQYLLNYYNIIKQKIPQPSQDGSNGDSLPIGTIIAYNGPLSAIPAGWHLCDGSDGTPNLRGKFLEGADTAGIYIDPGLPNIDGNFNTSSAKTDSVAAFSNGAFYHQLNLATHAFESGYNVYANEYIYFDASRSSSIYGASETVQPPAYTVYYIIKIS